MQLGIGAVALATAHLVRQRLARAAVIGFAGGWLLWVVRPHLLALVTLAAGCAYVGGRVRASGGAMRSFMARPVGLLAVAFLVAFTVSQGAKFLGIEDLSLSSIEAELDEQTERSAQGGSQFDNGGNSLNPINLPRGAVTVLLRPFPWETESPLQLLSSLESAILAGIIVARLASLRAALSLARSSPFLLYCWVLAHPLRGHVLVVRQLRAAGAPAIAGAAGAVRAHRGAGQRPRTGATRADAGPATDRRRGCPCRPLAAAAPGGEVGIGRRSTRCAALGLAWWS